MPYEATDITSLMVLITWACINVPTYINPRIRHVLPSEARLRALFGLVGFSFSPDLFNVLQAAAPPPLCWFESLSSTVPKKVWGVYVLELKKPGRRPLIYIGSATAATGARIRLQEHKHGSLCPRYVKDAKRGGYKITHTALLAQCPLPAASEIPIFRTVVIALEAAFSCVFWAMHSRDKSYGFGNLCPWPRDSFKWNGLCSHSPLLELVRGDFDFTPEQLEEFAAAAKEKSRVYLLLYAQALRANPTEEYRATQQRNNEKQKPGTQARQQEAVANKTYYCAVCNVACRDNASLTRHNGTTLHKKRTVQGDEDFHCAACNLSFRYQSNFNQHKTSKGHINKSAVSI